ncbi:hypothetical protein ACGGZK_17375 [Agromyces sp. MMS24-K17]|uniref:hypothetical protein n=1 Tax=Agromyces sp. MMS24-K17 TaxID=3372850 RepID=UPI0037546274
MLAATLTGCEAPPWDPASTATPTTSAPATVEPVQNDLAAGSTTRTIEVGAVTLTIDYWSTLSMDQWTAAANKPLSFSLRGTVVPADGQKVYLSRASVTPEVRAADGTVLPGFDPIVDQATVSPGYLILDPYTYSQTFILPPVDPDAASIVLGLRYELLVQSTPTSTDYAKQTAVDTLTVAIAPSGGATGEPSEPGEPSEGSD